jgi:large subunit ribosomal protein L28
MARCTLCCKSATVGSNVSHSQVHTKRNFSPNLQKVNGLLLCTRCLKTINKQKKIEAEKMQERLELKQEKKNTEKK